MVPFYRRNMLHTRQPKTFRVASAVRRLSCCVWLSTPNRLSSPFPSAEYIFQAFHLANLPLAPSLRALNLLQKVGHLNISFSRTEPEFSRMTVTYATCHQHDSPVSQTPS